MPAHPPTHATKHTAQPLTITSLAGGATRAATSAAAAAVPGAKSAGTGAPSAGPVNGGSGGGPALPRVHVQELLSFDANEGPKQLLVADPGCEAPAAAVAALRIDPRVKVKAKRLGRDVSIKVWQQRHRRECPAQP